MAVQRPFNGQFVVISENTTTGKYNVTVYKSGVTVTGTPAVSREFDDTTRGQNDYLRFLHQMIGTPLPPDLTLG